MARLTYCDIAVERPAPEMPMSQAKIRTGSKIIFSIPPEVRPTIASAAIPSYLKILFTTQLAVIAGPESSM